MDKSSDKIQKMFNSIAEDYDFNNNFISLGLHKFIKTLCLKELNFGKGLSVLDLCCGTGDIARLIQRFEPTSKIIGVDFSEKMLEIARKKSKNITFLNENCMKLPFDDESFDICTISFGLRNVENKNVAVDEIYRVLKKGGQFMHLDFGSSNFLFNLGFKFLSCGILKKIYKNSQPYKYLIQSKEKFESPQELVKIFQSHQFRLKKVKNFLGGIISAQILEKN